MNRRAGWTGPFVLAGTVLALACGGDAGPLEDGVSRAFVLAAAPTCETADPLDIPAQICALFPAESEETALKRYGGILIQLRTRMVENAQAQAIAEAGSLLEALQLEQLEDPNGEAPSTTETAVLDLIEDVLSTVGFAAVGFDEETLQQGFLEVVGHEGGTFVTGDGCAGVSIPRNALASDHLLIADRLPDGFLLPTSLIQVPEKVSIEIVPDDVLTTPATVGLFAVTDDLTPAQVAQLRVAHEVGEHAVEILESALPHFELPCPESAAPPPSGSGASPAGSGTNGLSLAEGNGIGGLVSSFSPFGPVVADDNEEPTTIGID